MAEAKLALHEGKEGGQNDAGSEVQGKDEDEEEER